MTMKEQKNEVIKALLQGLNTDGGHHKQFYLEQALRLLCGDDYVEQLKAELEWEEGVPD